MKKVLLVLLVLSITSLAYAQEYYDINLKLPKADAQFYVSNTLEEGEALGTDAEIIKKIEDMLYASIGETFADLQKRIAHEKADAQIRAAIEAKTEARKALEK